MLFHNRAVLIANGPRGSYKQAKTSFNRWKYFHQLEVAFRLAKAVGLVKNKYVRIEDESIKIISVIRDNLVKIKKVALALEEVRKEGLITKVKDGKIFYPTTHPKLDVKLSKEAVLEAIFDKIKRIKGYGEIDKDLARENFQSKAISERMFVPEGQRVPLLNPGHFVKRGGNYIRLINGMAIDMAASRILYKHKKEIAQNTTLGYDITRADGVRYFAEQQARERNIEKIKRDLEADNPREIPALRPIDEGELPDYTFVISDVHLREYRHENTEELLRFIWMVKRLNGRLIIDGDFFDAWRAGGWGIAWNSNKRIMNALAKLNEVIFIVGNHDEELVSFKKGGVFAANPKWKVETEYKVPDRQIMILHGHQSDKFNRPGAWAGRWMTKMVTKMEMGWLTWLNHKTQGALSFLVNSFGFIFGPRLSARLVMLPKLIFPTAYVLDRKVKNIMEWLESEVEDICRAEGIEPSEEDPLTIVIGHIHFEGLSYLTERINKAIEERFKGEIKLIMTDSWEGGEGYVSDYAFFANTDKVVRKEVWKMTPD